MVIKVFSLDNDLHEIFHEDSNYFDGTNIQITRDIKASHVVTTGHENQIRWFIHHHNLRSGRFLVYTYEPFYSTTPQRTICVNGIDVAVMNVHNGGTFPYGIYHFFEHDLFRDRLAQNPLERKLAAVPFHKRLAMLASCHTRMHGKHTWDLCSLRAQIALRLLAKDPECIDIFGRGWPEFVPIKKNDRGSPEWRTKKQDILTSYYFNLCFENSQIPNYVTEKLWDAILNGCLPIYFGSEWVDAVFPSHSYLDYRQFRDPAELYSFIKAMSRDEFTERYNRCRDAMSQVTSEAVDACRQRKKALVVNVLNQLVQSKG